MAMHPAVLDTNIWISAALSSAGAPAVVVRRVLAQGVPVFSPATFEELQTRLWKPKFDRYLTLELRRRLLHDVQACALWVEPGPEVVSQRFSRDPDDDAFIHAAWTAEAAWLVSGDQDLLTIDKALPFQIVTPAQALSDPRFAASA